MKTIFQLTKWILAATFLGCIVISCKKDKNDDDPVNPGDGSIVEETGYCSDGWRQHQVNGKVRTVKEITEGEEYWGYDLLEFNAQGYLIKDYHYRSDGTDGRGSIFSYDGKRRLTKIVYGDEANPDEIAEFGYDQNGGHNKYLPTNIYSMEELRLQRGVTSVRYQVENEDPMVINFQSLTGNRLIMNADVGGLGLEDEFGSKEITIIVDCNNDYPTNIKFQNSEGGGTSAVVKFDKNEMPNEVIYNSTDGLVVITKFTVINDFLLMVSQEYRTNGTLGKFTECQYNDQGFCILEKDKYGVNRYSYEYDAKGNWTKRIKESSSDGVNYQVDKTILREYSYWE